MCGWNCRHSFGPGDLEHNPFKNYDEEENREAYDLSQKQRAMERRIRHTKTKLVALREASETTEDPDIKSLIEKQYYDTTKLLQKQNIQYNNFCEVNNLRPLSDRIQIAKWTREDSKKSLAVGREIKNEHKNWSNELGINTEVNDLEKYYKMKYNKPEEYELFQGYVKAVKKGDISPLVGYNQYKDVANEINQKLVGLETCDGVKIKSFTPHFVDRTIGQVADSHPNRRQGTPIEMSFEALKNGTPSKVYYRKFKRNGNETTDARQTYISNRARVAISVSDGRLIQVNPID